MNEKELVELLVEDLSREVYHMMFYLNAASKVEGLHREELREFFMKEAHEEMGHVNEFSDMISYLGSLPDVMNCHINWTFGNDPYDILKEIVRMEQEVANKYATRLQQTEPPHNDVYNPSIATLHVFYEDQIKNSQMTSWEVKKWLNKFS